MRCQIFDDWVVEGIFDGLNTDRKTERFMVGCEEAQWRVGDRVDGVFGNCDMLDAGPLLRQDETSAAAGDTGDGRPCGDDEIFYGYTTQGKFDGIRARQKIQMVT